MEAAEVGFRHTYVEGKLEDLCPLSYVISDTVITLHRVMNSEPANNTPKHLLPIYSKVAKELDAEVCLVHLTTSLKLSCGM